MLSGVGLDVSKSLSESAGVATSGSKTTGLAVLVDGGDDPVDAGVVADSVVLRINQDDLEVLVGRVLSHPVGVENTEVSTGTTNLALSLNAERALVLQLADTLSRGLTVDNVGHSLSLATSTADLHSVDDESLLSLVAKTTGLLGTSGASATVNSRQLTVLPSADAQQETHSVGLLLLPQLLKVLIGAHVDFGGLNLLTKNENETPSSRSASRANHRNTHQAPSFTPKRRQKRVHGKYQRAPENEG